MKIEFAHDEIKSYSNGEFVVENTGPFDAPYGSATAFLKAKATIMTTNGPKLVNVFRPAGSVIEGEVAPAETPETLAKAHNRESLQQMATEYGLDGDAYTNKVELATAILAAKGDK